MNLNLIIILSLLSYIYDINIDNHYKYCNNNFSINILLFIHHILSVYIHFGWINNNNPTIYLLLLVFTMIHWFTNNFKCKYTQYVNEKCNIDINYPLRDIIYFSGLKNSKYYKLIYYTYLIFIIIYLLYKK